MTASATASHQRTTTGSVTATDGASAAGGTTAAGSATATATPPTAADALLGMLFPFWQLAIGCVVLLATVAAGVRLARRGPSRMGTAMLVLGAAIVALAVVGVLTSGR